MTPTRLRAGALVWLLTLQFFVVEAVAERRFAGPYSRTDDVISTLGASESAAQQLMNASFVVQGALIVGGAVLLVPALVGAAARATLVLLGAAGLGVLLVGVFPLDGSGTMHAVGAVLYLVGGGLGLLALAYAVRPRSEVVGTILAVLGLVGTAASAFFLTGITRYLGEGGTERAAAYVLPVGLALAGVTLWRLGAAPAGNRNTRREEREQERAEREARAAERDAALEAAAGRGGHPRQTDDDPWAARRHEG